MKQITQIFLQAEMLTLKRHFISPFYLTEKHQIFISYYQKTFRKSNCIKKT